MKSVLIVDDKGGAELSEALADGSLSIAISAAGGALEAARASPPDAILVAGLGDASAKFVAHLRTGLRESCPPVLVVLGQRNDAVRDQCLTGGAADVSPEGQPEDVAARTDAILNGWLRGAPRKPFRVSVRTQRAKQIIGVNSSDLDPTGFSFSGPVDLPGGDLVRVSLPLQAGQVVLWGRVADLEDGERGVRFLGVSTEERVRLVTAIKAIETTIAPRGPVPVMTRSQATPAVVGPASAPPLSASSLPPVPAEVPAWVSAASMPPVKAASTTSPAAPASAPPSTPAEPATTPSSAPPASSASTT